MNLKLLTHLPGANELMVFLSGLWWVVWVQHITNPCNHIRSAFEKLRGSGSVSVSAAKQKPSLALEMMQRIWGFLKYVASSEDDRLCAMKQKYWNTINSTGVYTKFSGRLSEEPFPWLIRKYPCILIYKTGQPGCQLNLSERQIRLDLTSGRPLV